MTKSILARFVATCIQVLLFSICMTAMLPLWLGLIGSAAWISITVGCLGAALILEVAKNV